MASKKIETAGLIALREAMKKRGWTQADLQRAVEVKPGVATRWLTGERRPDIDSAARIERLLAIPASSWEDLTPAGAA